MKAIKVVILLLCFMHIANPLISQPKKINIVTFYYPPYMIKDDDSISGIFVDIVEEVFNRLKQPITITFYPGLRSYNMMEHGEVDAFFSVKKNPEREKIMLFPHEPLLKQDYVIFKSVDSNFQFDGNVKTLQKVSIGVLINMSYGSIFDKAVKEGIIVNIDFSPNMDVIFHKLIAKRMDVIIFSKDVGLSIIQKYGFQDKIIISGPPLETVESFIVFKHTPEGKQLSASFDRIMDEMKQDGTILKIKRKYE